MSSVEVSRPIGWEPKTKAQKAVLDSIGVIDFLLFGGAAGSMKTETMLVDAAQEYMNPRMHSLVVRESHKAIKKDIELKCYRLYSQMGATYNQTQMVWNWPWGSRVQLDFLEDDKSVYRYYGTEFSFIGVDESTFHLESPIRHLATMRLRSTDPSLKLRIRLGTNPGQIGGPWHKQLFQGPTCVHCMITDESRLPWTIYKDAYWPSDGKPVDKTTAFIPGRLHDHNLLGADYLKGMESLPEALRNSLLNGCWESYEGQFFDIWAPSRNTVKWDEIKDQLLWYFPRWVSCDWGFGSSNTSAHLHVKIADGTVITIDEIFLSRTDAVDTAMYINNRWGTLVVPDRKSERIVKPVAWFLSPDAWQNRGLRAMGGHSIADQMIQATGNPWEQASNDRVGGAGLMYNMLKTGQWKIVSDKCPKAVKAIPSRVHNPEKPGDYLKIKSGDESDDIADDLRYGIYSFVQAPRKPVEVVIAEALEQYEDPTIAMIVKSKIESEQRKRNSQVISYRTKRHGVN